MPTSKDVKDLESKVKKTVISAESFKKTGTFDVSKSIISIHKTTSQLAGHVRKVVLRVGDLEKKVNNNSRKITSLKNISAFQGSQIRGTNIGAKLPGSSADGVNKNIATITESVSSIADILSGRKKLANDTIAYERKKAEQEKRALSESKLEKRFEGLKKIAEKIIAPVKNILDKIIDFLTTVLLGRIVFKLIEWWGDPKNASKVRTVIRFLGDHWPKLLALYLTFGTSLGRFALGLTKAVSRGAVKLLAKIAMLAAAKKMRGARGVAKFLGGRKGKLAANVIGTGVALGGAYAVTQGFKGIGGNREPQQYSGGGYVAPKFPTFAGGGFNNFRDMIGGASLGAMFGPLGMLLGGAFGSGKPQQMISGFVSGEKGVDKVPAMLSDGEFVMSRGAVQKYGVDTLEAMNAAGGGTNKPKIMSGTTYAAGGGYMGDYMSEQVKLRPATINEMAGKSQTLRNLLGVRTEEEVARIVNMSGNKVPDIQSLIGKEQFNRLQQGLINKFSEGADEQTFKGLRRVYQQHFGIGEEFEKMMSNRVDQKIAEASYKPTPKRRSISKPRITRLDPSRMLPAVGESSASKMAQLLIREPIPASRAIVPYRGEGLVRSGMTGGLSEMSIQQTRTNMNVPGGRGRGGMVGTLLTTLMEIFKPQIQSAVGSLYDKMGIGMGNLSDAELRKQIQEEMKIQQTVSSGPFGATINAESDRLSLLQQEMERRNPRFKGGLVKGGYGLRQQSFKDMPKTQIMTDDKGRPFVGYKAMRNGKPVYIKGTQPGAGTTNPFEAFGRMINPGAYKNIDAENTRKKYDEASKGSIASLQSRGASQATIARTRSRLKKVGPPIQKKPRVIYIPAGGGMNGRRGSGSNPSRPRTPNFSATTPGMRSKQETLGLMR